MSELEIENQRLQAVVESLRRGLADPPADVQELVIRKLNLVAAESRDQWKGVAQELVSSLRAIPIHTDRQLMALSAFDNLNTP